MKHFRLFSLFFGCWLLASCTADPGTEPGPFGENPPTAEKPHAVPVEQALEELQSVLEEIDIPAEDGAVTRSGGIRRVKNVTTVSPEVLNPDGTRSEATADVEDLLYIVNFENEAGYAILGADDRLEPVYAVVDEGSLTTEDFRYAVTVTPEQAEADGELVFPLQMVAQAAIIGIENADIDADGGVAPMSDDGRHTGDLGGNVLREEYTPFVVQERIGPLIPVKWGQGAPYNVCCPLVHGQSPVAGCGAIAAAQVMVSNYWNYGYAPKSIGKTAIDWTLIRRTILSPKLVSSGINGMPSPEGYAVALLIAAVGIDIDPEYGLEESMAYAYDLQGFLIRMPSKNVTYETYKNSCVRNMLHDQQKATIMRGVHIENGEKKAHFWNLDGWLYRTRYIKTYYRNGTVSQRGPFGQTLVHCNFGWEGVADGYYYDGIFDLSKGPVMPEDSDAGTPASRYYKDLSIFTYTLVL